MPRDHQARFLYKDVSDSNYLKQLVFDYTTGTWSHWYGSSPLVTWYGDQYYHGDIEVVGNNVYLIDASGKVLVEAPGRYYDVFNPVTDPQSHYHIDWSIQSPWIKLEGFQGVQRIWRSNLAFKTADWATPSYIGAPTPTLGLNTTISVDYGDYIENHPGKNQEDLEHLKNTNTNIAYVMVGHQYQACRGFQIQMSSSDVNAWRYDVDPSGIYELLGWWSEFGIEPGTGRLPADNKI